MAHDPSLQTPLLQHSEILSCLGLGSDLTHPPILLPHPIIPDQDGDINPAALIISQKQASSQAVCKSFDRNLYGYKENSSQLASTRKEIISNHKQECGVIRDSQYARPVDDSKVDSDLEREREFSIITVLKLSMSFFFVYSAMNALSGYVTSVLPNELGDESLLVMQTTLGTSALVAPALVAAVGELRGMMIGGLAHVVYFTALALQQGDRRWLVLVASTICGFGASLTWVAHGTFLTRCSPASKRGLYSGVFWGIFYLAGIVGNLLSFLVYGRLTKTTMFAAGAASATIGVLLLHFIKDPSPRRQLDDTASNYTVVGKKKLPPTQMSSPFGMRSLLLLFLLAPATLYSGSGPAFRTAEFTKLLPTEAIGAVLLCTGLGQAAGSFALSWLSDLMRYGSPTFLVGILCSSLGMIICPTLIPSATSANMGKFPSSWSTGTITSLHISPVLATQWPAQGAMFSSNVVPVRAFVGGLSFGIAEGVITSHLFAMYGKAFRGHGPLIWAIFSMLSNAGAAATYWIGLLFPMQLMNIVNSDDHDDIGRNNRNMLIQLWAQAILLFTGAPLYFILDICSLHKLPFKLSSAYP